MNGEKSRQPGLLIVLAVLLATCAVSIRAQEPGEDDLQPAVDTSAALEPAVDTSTTAPDAVSPQAALIAADVEREQSGAQVMDRLDLERTEITGNQELPKVLYIVPWQKSDPGELMGRPVNTLLDEVLAPVDREEFLRQVEYYDDLYGTE